MTPTDRDSGDVETPGLDLLIAVMLVGTLLVVAYGFVRVVYGLLMVAPIWAQAVGVALFVAVWRADRVDG